MSVQSTPHDSGAGPGGRPPRAVVGSQISRDEEMFGALFDGGVVRRFMEYVRPYKRRVVLSIAAVLIATFAQLAIPLVIRHGIDIAVLEGGGSADLLNATIIAFAFVITVNFVATWWQDLLVGLTGENVIFDLRSAMFAHLQHEIGA